MFKVGQRVWIVEEKKYAKITKVDDITFFDKVAYDIEIENDDYTGYWRFGIALHETADDMFEKLGYEKKIKESTCLTYNNKNLWVEFDLDSKSYLVWEDWCSGLNAFNVLPQLHLAIHQKLIELGWVHD